MSRSSDGRIIQKSLEKIEEDTQTALLMMAIGLVNPKECGIVDQFMWSFTLGKLYAMMMEERYRAENEKPCYNEDTDLIIEEHIREKLDQCDVATKANILAFITSAISPTTQKDVESLVGRFRG
jgi:hypothetical protein